MIARSNGSPPSICRFSTLADRTPIVLMSLISAACAPMGPAGAAASIRRSPSQIAMGTSARRPYHVVDEARPDLRGAGAVSLHRAVPRSLDGDHRLQARARPLLDARHSFLVLRAADAQALPPAVHADVVRHVVREHGDGVGVARAGRSEEHTSELQSRLHLVCRLLLEKKKKKPMKLPP